MGGYQVFCVFEIPAVLSVIFRAHAPQEFRLGAVKGRAASLAMRGQAHTEQPSGNIRHVGGEYRKKKSLGTGVGGSTKKKISWQRCRVFLQVLLFFFHALKGSSVPACCFVGNKKNAGVSVLTELDLIGR